MATNMAAWAASRSGAEPDGDEPVSGHPSVSDEDVDSTDPDNEEPTKSPEDLQDLAEVVVEHLPEIEAQIQMLHPRMLLTVERELDEDDADKILELIDSWGDGFDALVSGISEPDAIALSDMIGDEVAEVEPILVGAWVFRAGQLA